MRACVRSIPNGLLSLRTKAKVFKNGRSQAIRLPKDFRVKGDEFFLERTDRGFIVTERDPWDVFVESCREISYDSLPERTQPPLDSRAPLK